jgi:BirA family biotin operon repressor/biotin-[acetyl-CoA-carboxylase] ligase
MNTKDDCVNYAILGIGLNANFPVDGLLLDSLDSEATSILDELETEISLETLLASLLEELEQNYGVFMESGFSALLNRWKRYATFLGQQVVIKEQGVKGLALDVDVDGALLVKLKDGSIRKILVGDVSLS